LEVKGWPTKKRFPNWGIIGQKGWLDPFGGKAFGPFGLGPWVFGKLPIGFFYQNFQLKTQKLLDQKEEEVGKHTEFTKKED